jgi:hypothetical protein
VSNPLDSAGTIHDQPPEQNVGSERRFRMVEGSPPRLLRDYNQLIESYNRGTGI